MTWRNVRVIGARQVMSKTDAYPSPKTDREANYIAPEFIKTRSTPATDKLQNAEELYT